MENEVTVVLGWDGLDYELVNDFGLSEAFGRKNKRIETIDNEKIGEPHTSELWPTIITGLEPAEHGIGPRVSEGRAEWRNPVIERLSSLASGIVPKPLRTKIGEILLERGAELDYETPAYYKERGINTVFDGRRGRSIGIPNYRTEADEELGVVFHRSKEMENFLYNERDEEGETVHRPRVPITRLEERLVSEMFRKIGIVRTCLQRSYDIIFVWLGFIDTIGHLAPVVNESGWQKRCYSIAARVTREIANELTEGDTLVCLSDHGLQEGSHTHETFFGSNRVEVVNQVDSVLDVRDALESVTASRKPDTESSGPAVRTAFTETATDQTASAEKVRSNLEDLGYL